MSLIWNGIQGGYAFLLVAQILIVSGLVLSLLYLVVKRTMDTGAGLSAGREMMMSQAAEVSAEVSPGLAAAGATGLPSTAEPAPTRPVDADIEKVYHDKKNLEDKVKFLESKLLEYEILQEEISTLSALKVENENLKLKMQQLGSDPMAQPKIDDKLIFDPPKPEATTASAGEPTGEKAIEDLLQDIDNLTKS